jgi:hypothetical protein
MLMDDCGNEKSHLTEIRVNISVKKVWYDTNKCYNFAK